jgi:hypothetical protein
MSPLGVTATTNEQLQAGAGIPVGTGTLFIAGVCDQGPPVFSATTYVKCQSIGDYIAAFGPRTSTSATLYDSLDLFFQEQGSVAYVVRVTDNTATAATLTLSDAIPHPTVTVTAASPGLAGNNIKAAVTSATAATFTANTSSGSPNLAVVSSFANLGVGTPITGTGIPANTYILSVNTGAGTAVLTANATATATGVTITPSKFTVTLTDLSGNVLETHGPFSSTAALFADTSAYVTFTQSAGSGFTTNAPATLAATALSGGADASDLTDASHVAALASFPPTLGPGTVCLPGKTGNTIWAGLDAHAQANNRFAVKAVADSPTAATLIASIGSYGTSANASYGLFVTSTVIVPGITPGTTRTVPAETVVAALRAQVAATGNDNQAPIGRDWPLRYVTGFTNTYSDADMNTLNTAGINTFANRYGVLCLFGFSTPVSSSNDLIFWQAAPAIERMSLVARGAQILEGFMGAPLDGRSLSITHAQGLLQGLIADDWANGALFGESATDAGSVLVGPPINTPTTMQAGQLNANMKVRISPFAQAITLTITSIPITQTV